MYASLVAWHLNGLVPSAAGLRPTKKRLPLATSTHAQGVKLFVKFKMSYLTEQMRARLDEAHCTALEAARELEAAQPLSEALLARLAAQRVQRDELATPLTAFAPLVAVSQKEKFLIR